VCRTTAGAANALETSDVKKCLTRASRRENPPIVFMFPGQGAQEVNMGLELYQHEPVFREQVDACCAMLKPHLGFDLHTVLYPTAGTIEDAKKLLTQTSVTQPALFVIEYALAKLWMSWGVQPEAMIGHSIGEYVAACLAGVFALEDALQLIAARGRMMQQLRGGTMLAVRLPEQEVKPFLSDKISLAVINSPSLCVVAGPDGAIEMMRHELSKRGVTSMPLQTSHAFHSAMMDPILERFAELAGKMTLNAPQIPYLSNVTGTWIHPGQAISANYWSKHLRQTVRFAAGLAELYNDQGRILLEVGPGRTLSNLAKQYPAWNANGAAISSLGNKGETITDSENVLGALGQLWLHGVRINWENFYKSEKRRRVHLPAYPFEHRRFWIEPGKSIQKQAIPTAPEARPSEPEEAIAIPICQVTSVAATPADQIKETLRQLLGELSGLDPAAMDGETTFTAMGFDSLFLTQASVMIEKKLGVRVGFRHFLEEYSTVNALSAHIAGFLRPETEKKPAVDENETKATAPVAPPQIFSLALTDAQRELWFASQMSDGASCAYNECQLLDLRGPLKQGALLGSLMKLARRHEALRTVFASDGGLQYVHPAVKLKIPLLDWSKLESDEQSSRLDAVQLEEGSQPFDFVRGPLLRAQLIRLGEEHFLFIVTVHHIVCDGHSLGILLRELAQMYSDTCRGARGELGAPLQLSEYVRRKSEDASLQADEDFWLKEFADGAPVLKLPADRPRPATWTFDGAVESRVLPASLGQQLKNLNVRQGGTLFTTLLAGYAILLHKLAGENEVVIGIPIADRTMAGAETLIGHCVNFLPLRVKIKDETFAEFRAGLQQQFLDAYDHQRFMFSSLIQKLNLPRDTNRMPLVSATINVQRFGESLQFDGLKAEIHANAHASTDFDLAFNLTEINDELLLHCGYHASLFSPETVRRWLEHFQTLLQSAAADPGQRVSDLSLLAPEDRRKILNDWSGGQASFPGHKCIHQLFEEQVARTPEAMAVVLDGQSLSYAELNRRANRLAHCLRSLGVGPEVMVGLCLERSIEMVISILAVLKAGGAYVPMDPAYPAERLAFVLQDAQAPVLLTQRALLTRFQAHQPGVVCVDEFFDSQDSSHDENAGTEARPPNLAYMIYTSGSTGKPKGVQVTHENVTRLFQATQPWYQFNESDVWTLFHSYAFDFSVWEIWGALLYGGRLVVVPHLVSRSPEKFLELLAREKVTVLNQTPSAFRQLIQADQRTLPQPELALRYIIFGGEALELRSLKPWFDRHGDQRPQLVNMYGITETTVHVTYRPINAQDLGSGSVIGQPIPDLQIYILDARLQPVPIGLPGEMYVGGAGVARGYLNRPELTAEKFIPNPFNEKAGDRLYKTGDLARWLANGDIEYLGRADHQVKIRGHRIELGEIESTLAQHPAMRECVVLARVDSPGDERLAAYLVTEPDKASISLGELRNFLKTKLPEHMIPAAFVFLDALPLTPNGKVDRKALPAPEKVRPELDESFAAPNTPTEIAVAEIWREVLQLERVGLHDNFFELGGHSLLMTQIVSRLREAFQIELPMRRFFESPTIEKLALVIEELLTDEIRQMSDKEAQNQAQEELTRKI
jgi:amino acid adenylation domain-containing protein